MFLDVAEATHNLPVASHHVQTFLDDRHRSRVKGFLERPGNRRRAVRRRDPPNRGSQVLESLLDDHRRDLGGETEPGPARVRDHQATRLADRAQDQLLV